MTRLQTIFSFIDEVEGLMSAVQSHEMVAEIRSMLGNQEEMSWLKDQLGALSSKVVFFLQTMSFEVKFPEGVAAHLHNWVAHNPPSGVHYSLSVLLAFQGDPFGLEVLGNYIDLYGKIRNPSIVLEALMAIHTERAKALIERYCCEGTDPDARSEAQDYLKRWDDEGTHRCSWSFDSPWED